MNQLFALVYQIPNCNCMIQKKKKKMMNIVKIKVYRAIILLKNMKKVKYYKLTKVACQLVNKII
jgi:hypothetical protein